MTLAANFRAVRELRRLFPWPGERPDFPDDWFGWLADTTAEMLTGYCPADASLIVELGTWKGVSARALLQHSPQATLVCVDTWRGSPEHQPETGNDLWSQQLPELFHRCQANLWPWRERVVLLRADSIEGLECLTACGATPQFFYVDAEHSVERVTSELSIIQDRWPAATIVGDDYNNVAVRLAADNHAKKTGRTMVANETAFCFPGA